MGLYTGEPGRNPAEEAAAQYHRVKALAEHDRRPGAPPEAAEWVLREGAPLLEEFFDSAELIAWTSSARVRLAIAYRSAGLDAAPEGLVGLFDARLKLKAAEAATTAESIVTAELSFKHVLHHHPGAGSALAGLARLELLERALQPPSEKRRIDAPTVEQKLQALIDICQWPECTTERICTGCRFADRVTVAGESRVEGCHYRKKVVTPLSRTAGAPLGLPEGPGLIHLFDAAPGGVRSQVAAEIESLFRLIA